MKHVAKSDSPPAFEEWKSLKNEDWTPAFENLQSPQKSTLHESLLKEQGWVCCYCGRSISKVDSHIEHFRPQSKRPDLELAYVNLHASCIRETDPGMPLHCGHAKLEEFDEALQLSPLDPACETAFIYTWEGRISSTDVTDECAAYMCRILKLDTPFLRNRRQEVLRKTFDPAFLDSASAAELEKLRDAYRVKDSSGKLDDFGHVASRYAQQRLADIPRA